MPGIASKASRKSWGCSGSRFWFLDVHACVVYLDSPPRVSIVVFLNRIARWRQPLPGLWQIESRYCTNPISSPGHVMLCNNTSNLGPVCGLFRIIICDYSDFRPCLIAIISWIVGRIVARFRDQYGWHRSGYQIEPCKFTDMVWIWLIPTDKTVTGRNRGFL
jgi:hypothetical protein